MSAIKSNILLAMLLTLLNFLINTADSHQVAASQRERFLSMFTVVRFRNSGCTGTDGTSGICYTSSTCKSEGGKVDGTCAQGFGSCCVTVLICDESSSNNGTIIRSPGYPSYFNYAKTCPQTITLADDICQVRLDITSLELAAPSTSGNCINDYLQVSQDNKIDKLCGVTTDNHFYLDVDPSSSNSLLFNFVTDSSSNNRRWSITVYQLTCNQRGKAPTGCGQYYTSESGTIKGLNSAATTNKQFLSGLNYAICVRREINKCSTTYLDQTTNSLMPRCPDTFERPYYTTTLTASCMTGMSAIAAAPLTFALVSPQYFYFNTKIDTANTHDDDYLFTYTQAAC